MVGGQALAAACLCLAAAGLSWVWSAGGRRFTVLPHSPTANNLLTVTITEEEQGRGRHVERVVAQGREVALSSIYRTSTEKAMADQLDRCGMCIGVTDLEKIEAAESSAAHKLLVQEL